MDYELDSKDIVKLITAVGPGGRVHDVQKQSFNPIWGRDESDKSSVKQVTLIGR